jgi:hypothetical protein
MRELKEWLFDPWYRNQPEWWFVNTTMVGVALAWPLLMLVAYIASLVR